MVRIINRKTAERALLKDLTGKVVDIAFAYTDDVILAAVDEVGNLLVHSVREGDDKKIDLIQVSRKHWTKTPKILVSSRAVNCPSGTM